MQLRLAAVALLLGHETAGNRCFKFSHELDGIASGVPVNLFAEAVHSHDKPSYSPAELQVIIRAYPSGEVYVPFEQSLSPDDSNFVVNFTVPTLPASVTHARVCLRKACPSCLQIHFKRLMLRGCSDKIAIVPIAAYDVSWRHGDERREFFENLTLEEQTYLHQNYRNIYYLRRAPEELKFEAGESIGFRYEVRKVIGTGASSTVVYARDHKLKRKVAVKIYSLHHDACFWKEHRIYNRIATEHPDDTCYIQAVDKFEFRGVDYLILPLLSGDLKTFVAKQPNRQLNLQQIKAVAKRMLTGLKQLHKLGVIHRDVKSANVLLKNGDIGQAYLTDFGNSVIVGEEEEFPPGTPCLDAPELLLGLPNPSFKLDMWSFALTILGFAYGQNVGTWRREYHLDNSGYLAQFMPLIGFIPDAMIEASSRRDSLDLSDQGLFANVEDPWGLIVPRAIYTNERERNLFLDFVKHCLVWDPTIRYSPRQALKHRFLK